MISISVTKGSFRTYRVSRHMALLITPPTHVEASVERRLLQTDIQERLTEISAVAVSPDWCFSSQTTSIEGLEIVDSSFLFFVGAF